MTQGYFAFVLHGHLPYVLAHGRWPHGMDWLNEATAETYLPILRVINELVEEGVRPKLTLGLSPVLCEQLSDNSFKDEFVRYLNQKIRAAQYDSEEFYKYGQHTMLANSHFWERFYGLALEHFNNIGQDILYEFRRLQDAGLVEIITCGATHGYYPLLSRDESLQAQTKAAVKNYEKHFGHKPRGLWLPECAYRPRYAWKPPVAIGGRQEPYSRKGVDEFLTENGLDFFIVDSVLLKGGKSIGVYIDRFEALKLLWGQFEKYYKPREEEFDKTPRDVYLVSSSPEGKKPTAIFTRDPETGLLVWSGEHGYPGDGNYLDFHKKRFPGGHRYWAVTSVKSDLADKVEYHRETALSRVPENADHFAGKVEEILAGHFQLTNQAGILVAPYDAELFGHWWFEGPEFLKSVLRNVCRSKTTAMTFLSEHLDRTQPTTVVSIPEGSWGKGNHHYIWLNEDNEWTWKHIYESEARMCELARFWEEHSERRDGELEDILKQAARELMLMSASDWQFLISTWAARDYAELRMTEHYADFKRLATMAQKKIDGHSIEPGEWQFLDDCKKRDKLFDEIDLKWFARVEFPASQP
ncbi:MAG TPA: 1,4-alpha-glucan branching protein domain-containing protein [Candidatus Deferrimicrobium sp.]|nr:1,4-alpha-glucan branching protein domain-containing protein [Candidatus Deferrimicrobium sp.]